MSYFLELMNLEHTFSHADFMYSSVMFMSRFAWYKIQTHPTCDLYNLPQT